MTATQKGTNKMKQARWKMLLDFSQVGRYGYEVDSMIEAQKHDRVRAEFEKMGE